MNLLTNENILIDTRPPGQKAIEKIANTVKSLVTEPRSVSNVVTQQFQLEPVYQPTGVNSQNYVATTVGSDGFPTYAVSPLDTNFIKVSLESPTSLKLANISEIITNCSLLSYDNQEAFGVFQPTATSNYSVKFYVTLAKLSDPLNTTTTLALEDYYFFFTFTFSYTLATNKWSVDSQNKELFLADTITTRPETSLGSGVPDFTTNQTKITNSQYSLFCNSPINLYTQTSFSKTEASALSGVTLKTWKTTPSNSNKAHFESTWGQIQGGVMDNYQSLYLLKTYLNFNYFGLLTPYAKQS